MADLASVPDVDGLNQWMSEHNLQGYWAREPGRHEVYPYLWKWPDIEACIYRAAEVVPIEQAFRRNIGLRNPRNSPGAMTNIILGVQCVLPGEVAPSHRHSASAIRFVIRGNRNAAVICDGEPMPMEEGDLITNPHLTFHGHVNRSDEPVIWLDGLDVRLATLGHEFREDYTAKEQEGSKSVGFSLRTMGHVRPSAIQSQPIPPPFRYPWTETQATFAAMVANEVQPDPFDGYHLMYRHPITGGATLPTFACEIQSLPAGFTGKSHQHNSMSIFQVFRGQGATTVGDERFEWSKGDFLFVPAWSEHRHENTTSEDAILFSISDWPAMKALGLYDDSNPLV